MLMKEIDSVKPEMFTEDQIMALAKLDDLSLDEQSNELDRLIAEVENKVDLSQLSPETREQYLQAKAQIDSLGFDKNIAKLAAQAKEAKSTIVHHTAQAEESFTEYDEMTDEQKTAQFQRPKDFDKKAYLKTYFDSARQNIAAIESVTRRKKNGKKN